MRSRGCLIQDRDLLTINLAALLNPWLYLIDVKFKNTYAKSITTVLLWKQQALVITGQIQFILTGVVLSY